MFLLGQAENTSAYRRPHDLSHLPSGCPLFLLPQNLSSCSGCLDCLPSFFHNDFYTSPYCKNVSGAVFSSRKLVLAFLTRSNLSCVACPDVVFSWGEGGWDYDFPSTYVLARLLSACTSAFILEGHHQLRKYTPHPHTSDQSVGKPVVLFFFFH
jgi:hypothetical protein